MSPPSPSLLLLHSCVRTDLPGDCTDHKVVPLSSGGVQAFGFDDGDDEDIDPALLGLVLEAHLAIAPDLSFLTLPGGSRLFTSINTVDKNLIVIASAFPQNHHREIFLIFDAANRSLRVIPAVPRSFHRSRTNRVLAVRHRDDENTPYSLVIPGEAVFFFLDFQYLLMKVEKNSTLWLQQEGK
jgi:hypothetical protein